MRKFEKLYKHIITNKNDNVSFSDFIYFIEHLGADGHIHGDHYLYRIKGVAQRINVQPQGNMAKPYQVRQIRQIVQTYRLWEAE